MDLFGRKRIKELEAENAHLRGVLADWTWERLAAKRAAVKPDRFVPANVTQDANGWVRTEPDPALEY